MEVIEANPLCKKFLEVAPYKICSGTSHLEKYFQDVADQGGEGIILRDPLSSSLHGRSAGFLKHKVPYVLFEIAYFRFFKRNSVMLKRGSLAK